jgi:hypothetical protein
MLSEKSPARVIRQAIFFDRKINNSGIKHSFGALCFVRD